MNVDCAVGVCVHTLCIRHILCVVYTACTSTCACPFQCIGQTLTTFSDISDYSAFLWSDYKEKLHVS